MSINSINNSSLNQLNRVHSASANSIKKLASGSQYPDASFGGAAYAISIRMNSHIGATSQSYNNTQTTNAMLNVASGAVNNTVSTLSDLRSQILSAANGTNQDTDIAALSKNVSAAVSSINDNAATEFNGQTLLDGEKTVTVAGVSGYENVSLGNMTAQGLGLTDENGKSTLDLTTSEGRQSALDAVDNALNAALDQATTIGAKQQGLAYAANNYTTEEENETAALSIGSDLDMAKEATKLKSSETQEQLALQAQKLFMHNNASVLQLLR